MKGLMLLIVSLLFSSTGARLVPASPLQKQSELRAEKVKAGVKKLGVGESAHVEVRLRNGNKLKGYIKEAGDDNFVVFDKKAAMTQTVKYEEVDQLKGKSLSTGAKVAIGFAIAFAVLGALVIYGLTHLD